MGLLEKGCREEVSSEVKTRTPGVPVLSFCHPVAEVDTNFRMTHDCSTSD